MMAASVKKVTEPTYICNLWTDPEPRKHNIWDDIYWLAWRRIVHIIITLPTFSLFFGLARSQITIIVARTRKCEKQAAESDFYEHACEGRRRRLHKILFSFSRGSFQLISRGSWHLWRFFPSTDLQPAAGFYLTDKDGWYAKPLEILAHLHHKEGMNSTEKKKEFSE